MVVPNWCTVKLVSRTVAPLSSVSCPLYTGLMYNRLKRLSACVTSGRDGVTKFISFISWSQTWVLPSGCLH